MKLLNLVCALTFCGLTAGASPAEVVPRQEIATVTWDGASAPLGRFLLIRKDRAICAVRFAKAQRNSDKQPQTTFNSGEESSSAEYDWYFQGDASGDLSGAKVLSGYKKLHRGTLKGIGRLAFRTGDSYVKCGPFELSWQYPTWIGFWGAAKRGDYGFELAPTRWATLPEVNVHDPHLKWFRYDEHREQIEIPLKDL